MKTLFIYITLALLTSITSLRAYAFNKNNEIDSTTIVSRIDFSNDSIMYRILEEVTDTVYVGYHPVYYTLCMEKYKDGTMIRIEQSESDIFEARGFPFAYTTINNQLIVIYHVGGYNIKDARPKETKTIKIARKEDNSDITERWFYFILGDVYAKFSPEAGWLWSDGKPDE